MTETLLRRDIGPNTQGMTGGLHPGEVATQVGLYNLEVVTRCVITPRNVLERFVSCGTQPPKLQLLSFLGSN